MPSEKMVFYEVDDMVLELNYREQLSVSLDADVRVRNRDTSNASPLTASEVPAIPDGYYFGRVWAGHRYGMVKIGSIVLVRLSQHSSDHVRFGLDVGMGNMVFCLRNLLSSTTTAELQTSIRTMELSGNYLLTDRKHMAYQQSGLLPVRTRNQSGLYPVTAWDHATGIEDRVDPLQLLAMTNSMTNDHLDDDDTTKASIFVTANDLFQRPSAPTAITLHMAAYRADRIRTLLESRADADGKLGLDDLAGKCADRGWTIRSSASELTRVYVLFHCV